MRGVAADVFHNVRKSAKSSLKTAIGDNGGPF